MDVYVRTTVKLREDHYRRLKASPEGMSAALNEMLSRQFRRDHSMFGALRDAEIDLSDVRDHEDRV